MNHLAFFSFVMLLFACSSTSASESIYNKEGDFYILLSNLLGVNKKQYTYIDTQGNRQPNLLKRFKKLEKVYIKNIEPDLADDKFSFDRLKMVMFFSFYSYEKKSAAFQEYLAVDLMRIYADNKITFMEILKELPFLIQSNCDRLNSFFGFEGKNDNKKTFFIEKNEKIFDKYLTHDQARLCMENFK